MDKLNIKETLNYIDILEHQLNDTKVCAKAWKQSAKSHRRITQLHCSDFGKHTGPLVKAMFEAQLDLAECQEKLELSEFCADHMAVEQEKIEEQRDTLIDLCRRYIDIPHSLIIYNRIKAFLDNMDNAHHVR